MQLRTSLFPFVVPSIFLIACSPETPPDQVSNQVTVGGGGDSTGGAGGSGGGAGGGASGGDGGAGGGLGTCTTDFAWFEGIGDVGDDRVEAVAVDTSGAATIAGIFSGTMQIGTATLVSKGAHDVFVARLDAAGKPQWAISTGGIDDDIATAMGLDANGDIFVTGAYWKTMTVDGGTLLQSKAYRDIFVLKLSGGDGHLLSSATFGGPHDDVPYALAVNAAGDVAIAGKFYETITFGATALTDAGQYDAFVAKLSGTDLGVKWSARGGGPGGDEARGLAFLSNGDLVVAANVDGFRGGDMAGISFNIDGNWDQKDIVFVRYAGESGQPVWAKDFGATYFNAVDVLEPLGNDGFVVAGHYAQPFDFGTGPASDGAGLFVAAFTGTGNAQWMQSLFSPENYAYEHSVASALAVDVMGNIHLAATLRMGMENDWKHYEGFVGTLSPMGQWQWQSPIAGMGNTRVTDVAISKDGLVYATGNFERQIDPCSASAVNAAGGMDGFVTKFAAHSVMLDSLFPKVDPPVLNEPMPGQCTPAAAPPSPLPPTKPVPTYTTQPLPSLPLMPFNRATIVAGVLPANGNNPEEIFANNVSSGTQPQPSGKGFVFRADGMSGSFADLTSIVLSTPLETIDQPTLIPFDFNKDGRMDVFLSQGGYDLFPWPGTRHHLVLRQPDGTLQDAPDAIPTDPALRDMAQNEYTHRAAIGDIDCNGFDDVYLSNIWGMQAIPPRLWLNDSGKRFVVGDTSRLPAFLDDLLANQFTSATVCDIDGDGAPEIILGPGPVHPEAALLMNDRTGHFAAAPSGSLPTTYYTGGQVLHFACGDLDLDGDNDLVVEETDDYTHHQLTVWKNNGNLTMSRASDAALPADDTMHFFFILADVNDDGWLDVVPTSAAGNQPKSYSIFVNGGGLTFTRVALGNLPAYFMAAPVPVHANADAKLDLFVLFSGNQTHQVLLQAP